MRSIILFSLLFISLPSIAAPHNQLDMSVKLKTGQQVLIYDASAKVVVKNAKGQITQTSCFKGCVMPLKQASYFLMTLQKYLKTNNVHRLDDMMSYPLRINNSTLKVNNARDFRKYYRRIFTPKIKQQILKQNPYTLFANMQGVMIDGGVVWFNLVMDKQQHSKPLVIAINH